MNYNQAMNHILTVRWKTSTCPQGSSCWCRVIEPETAIQGEYEDDLYIVPAGSISKDHAEHIVELHNKSLNPIK